MPQLEHMDFHTKAILWVIAKHDKSGKPLLSPPVQICCRWEEKQTQMVNEKGEDILVDVVLATNRDIVTGSLLWEGSTECLALETNSIPESNIYELIVRDRGYDLKGRVTRYEFGLKRYTDTLPALA